MFIVNIPTIYPPYNKGSYKSTLFNYILYNSYINRTSYSTISGIPSRGESWIGLRIPMNLMQKNPRLCVVERGAVGRLGRILVPWGYWGEDVKIGSKWLLGICGISFWKGGGHTYESVLGCMTNHDEYITYYINIPEYYRLF